METRAHPQSRAIRAAAATWIRAAARIGHLATGVVYVIVGGLAFVASVDGRVHPMGSQGALGRVLSGSLGRPLLLAIAAGLTADFVWQTVRAVTNADMAPAGIKGASDRVGWLISGVAHLGLAIAILKLVLGVRQHTAEHQAKASTAAAMAFPFGRWIVVLGGLIVILVGLQMLRRAWIGDVDRWLDLGRLPDAARSLVMALGRFGLAARAIVFSAGGAFLTAAAIHERPWTARGLGGTLRALQQTDLGPPLLTLVGLGFVAFGVVEMVSARYRRIRVP